MKDRRLVAIADELRVWREMGDARRHYMEDLIVDAEQAVSRARSAVERAWLVRAVLARGRAGFGPTSSRLFGIKRPSPAAGSVGSFALRSDRPKRRTVALRASVGSTEASASPLARFGVVGPLCGQPHNEDGLESAKPDLQSTFKKPGD